MKIARALAILILVSSVPASAQGVDWTGWVSWAELGSTDLEDPEFDVNLEFESSVGFGISANWFWWDRFSIELAAMALEPEAEVTVGGFDQELDFGRLDMMPITLTFQAHLNPDARFDPYIGLGAAYVMVDGLASDDLRELGTEEVEVDDEFTFLVNAGVGISISPNFGITIDARYIPLEPVARAVDDPEELDLELNPLIISAGLRWRFGQ